MTTLEMALLFAVIGIVVLAAEAFLPSHGVLTVVGGGAILVAVACCFGYSWQAGIAALVGLAVLTPVVTLAMIRVWPSTPMGRRIALPPVAAVDAPTGIAAEPGMRHVGERGVTITALRPTGVCEFAGERVEAVCDLGPLDPGTPVHIVSIDQKRPVVRPLQIAEAEARHV